MDNKKYIPTATMRDVAKLAGVSTATVSRALVTPEKVALRTLKNVEAAAESLGYSAHTLTRNIKRTETRVIAVVIPDIVFTIFNHMIKHM
ncbi:MAG: LacI family DNA-binding transcriptional regulator [Enterobacteriaceae bacterium]